MTLTLHELLCDMCDGGENTVQAHTNHQCLFYRDVYFPAFNSLKRQIWPWWRCVCLLCDVYSISLCIWWWMNEDDERATLLRQQCDTFVEALMYTLLMPIYCNVKNNDRRKKKWSLVCVCVCVRTHYADTDAVKIVRGEQLAEYAWGCSSSLLFDDTELSQCYDYAQFCSFACR